MPLGTTILALTLTGAVGSALVGTSNCLRWDNAKLGLYNTAPVTQATRVGQAVDSTGGTPSGTRTLVDVTTAAVADPAKINANFATLATNMWNPLVLALHNLGATT